MSFPIAEALSLIDGTLLLLKDETAILASPEDAAYFRTQKAKPIQPALYPVPIGLLSPLKLEVSPPSHPLFVPIVEIAAPPPPKVEEKPKAVPQQSIQPFNDPPARILQGAVSPIRSILAKIAPELAILDKIPNDAMAKQISSRWKTKNQSAPISILTSGELPQHKALLAEIATALDVYFGPARLVEADGIEKEKQWGAFLSTDGLKLVVACDSTLWQLHYLRQFYKEHPSQGTRSLGNASVLLLPDLSLYFKDPLLKRSLWKALCQKLS